MVSLELSAKISIFGHYLFALNLIVTDMAENVFYIYLSLPLMFMQKLLFLLPLGESVDDCGGGYSESIAEMCEELQNGLTPLLIVTPNGRDESGANRDCFLLNPAAKSLLHMNMFRFLGNLQSIIASSLKI